MAFTDLEFHGNLGLALEDAGEITTDIYQLETCTAVFKCPQDRLDLIPAMFSPHPIFTYLRMEKRQVRITPGYLVITGDYAGISGTGTIPIYELLLGLSEEPIETHPKFVSDIAGNPSNPLNDAIFLDFRTGVPTTDNAFGDFDKFLSHKASDGSLNPWAGITNYLEAAELTWRKTYISIIPPPSVSSVGYISYPDGPVPGLEGSRNWISSGISYQQRGAVYSVQQEWRASGRNGWNSIIYST